jgi:hypothetical protein
MPLPLAPLFAALVGLSFGLVGRDEIRRSNAAPTALRGFSVVALVSLFAFTPAVGYFVAFYPDWSYAYFAAAARVPSAIDLVLVLAIGAVPPLAYVWVAGALREHAIRSVIRVAVALIAIAIVIGAVLSPRLLVSATTQGYADAIEVTPIGGTSLGVSIFWIDACAAAGTIWAARKLRQVGST